MKATLDLFRAPGRRPTSTAARTAWRWAPAPRESWLFNSDHRRHRGRRRHPAGRDQSAHRGAGAERAPAQELAGRQSRDRRDRRAGRPDLRLRLPGRRADDPGGLRQGRRRLRRGAEGRQAPGDHRRRGRAGRRRRRGGAERARPSVAKVGVVHDGWNGFNVLHTAAARVGGLDLGFVPGEGGKTAAEMVAKGGAGRAVPAGRRRDRRSRQPSAFVRLPGHPRRRRRAPRRRDPAGRRLHREERPLRQHRGPGADGRARRVPEGRGPGRLGDPARAVRARRRRRCPTTPWTQLRAKLFADHPTFGQIDYAPAPAGGRSTSARWAARASSADAPFASAVDDLLPDQPDRARQRDDGRVRRPARRAPAKMAAE